MWQKAFHLFSILVSLASSSGGAETTRKIDEVVDLRIPGQFLPANRADGQPEKLVKAEDVGENISNLVDIKIPPTIDIIKSSQQKVSVPNEIENVDEPGDDIETGENISNLDVKIPSEGTLQNSDDTQIIPLPTNIEKAKPSEDSISANIPEPDVPSDKIEPQAPQTSIIGDNKNSGGEDTNDAVDITDPGEESEIFVDISAIVDVKIPALNDIHTTTLPTIVTDQENVPTATTAATITTAAATAATTATATAAEETGRFKCINGITISTNQVCVFNGLLSLRIPQDSSNTAVMDVPEIIGLYNVKSILTDNSI